MKKQIVIATCALMLIASPLAAQTGSGSGSGTGSGSAQATTTTKDGKTATTTVRSEEFGPKFARSLTNVQIELTLTDQIGTQPPEKKIVSMIASSGNFGKVRSGSTVVVPGQAPDQVILNVDARPFVSVDGPIQLELTLVYEPAKREGDNKNLRLSGLNQSQTIILQSGKPLVVSQAADPVSDRKVVVEVKATVLK